jgi:gluconolactonase
MKVITDDLQFPEGPVCLPDGSFLVVEIRRGTLTRVQPDGKKHYVAKLGGGPNGAAIGPDGHAYVCNNGGFIWREIHGRIEPMGTPADYTSGRIERVNLDTGKFDVLYDTDGNRPLRGPNDIVFDAHGGFWFTDLGKSRGHQFDFGAVCYAKADGSLVRQVLFPMWQPNGIGLSPDGKTLYVAESATTPPTSASAARTCRRPTSPHRTQACCWRPTGRGRGCDSSMPDAAAAGHCVAKR